MYNTRKEIEEWLINIGIDDYVINKDLTVDVNGNVDISSDITNVNLLAIPIQFNTIEGDFNCDYNILTSLKGCPKIVNGNFYCHYNKLTSLEGCPEIINGIFNCGTNNLTSLKGCPEMINGDFYCHYNKLTNLEGCPEIINGDFVCHNNNLTSFEYFPKTIKGSFLNIYENDIPEEELVNFNCDITNVIDIYSDFNPSRNKEEFLGKMNYYEIKKENELLKKISNNNNKINKKL